MSAAVHLDPREASGSRARNTSPQPVERFHRELRYTVPETAWLLKQSVSRTWADIRDGRLKVIVDGGRRYIPGSEIVRRSTLEVAEAPHMHDDGPDRSTTEPGVSRQTTVHEQVAA